MATSDFRAKQVQAAKIIASGSTGTSAKLLVYPESSEDKTTPNVGAINPNAFNTGSIGADVFLYVSGATSARGSNTPGITVFGGDIHVSGTITSVGPISSDSDWALTGSTLFTSSSVMIGKPTKVTEEGTDVFTFLSGATNSKDTSTRGVTAVGGDMLVSGNLHVESDILSPSTFNVSSAVDLNMQAGDDLRLTTTDVLLVRVGDYGSFQLRSDVGTDSTSGSFNFYDLKQGGVDNAGLFARDVFFFVSGVVGSRNSTTRGTALFSGDVHVSGNISVDGTIPGSIAVLHTSSLVVASASALNFSGSAVAGISASGNTVTVNLAGGSAAPQFSMTSSIVDAGDSPYTADFGETVRVDNVSGAVQVNLPAAGGGDTGKQVKVVNLWTMESSFGSSTIRNLSQLKGMQNINAAAFTTVKTSTETIGLQQRDDGSTNNTYLMQWNAEALVFEFDGDDNWIIT